MTNSEIFKQAHAMTKATVKAGDDYQVTFGQCLKAIKAQQEQAVSEAVKVVTIDPFRLIVAIMVAFLIGFMGFIVGGAVFAAGFKVIGAVFAGGSFVLACYVLFSFKSIQV